MVKMNTYLSNLFNNGQNNGNVTVICKDGDFKAHSWVLKKCSNYYSDISHSSIIYLKSFNMTVVTSLFKILYYNNYFTNNIYNELKSDISNIFEFFNLVDMILIKEDIDISEICDHIINNFKWTINNNNFINILNLCVNVDNKHINNLRDYIINNFSENNINKIVKNYLKNGKGFEDYKKIVAERYNISNDLILKKMFIRNRKRVVVKKGIVKR
jgi:hypothetical protein